MNELNRFAESFKGDSPHLFKDSSLSNIVQPAMDKWGEEELKPIMDKVIDEKLIKLENRLKKTLSIKGKWE